MIKERISRLIEGAIGHSYYPHQLAFLIDNPVRRLLISPEQIAERLGLEEDSRVLEVGPGSGFFSVELARRVPRGHLELFDLQPEMLTKARRKLEVAGMQDVGFTLGDARELPFEVGYWVLGTPSVFCILYSVFCILSSVSCLLSPVFVCHIHYHLKSCNWKASSQAAPLTTFSFVRKSRLSGVERKSR